MQTLTWFLLAYKVPSEPSKVRVGIWRRLRAMGAVYIQGGVCVINKSQEHQRQLRMIQGEIVQSGGEAVIFETTALDTRQQALVIERFKRDRDDDYGEFLDKCTDFKREVEKEAKANHYTFAELQENDADLRKLKNWLASIKALDHFGASARTEADRQLVECEQVLEAYAQEVFEREHELPGYVAARKKTGTARRTLVPAAKGRLRGRQ